MMKRLSKKTICLAAAAITLTGTLAVGSACAYFTTYSTAKGSVKFNMGYTETTPHEQVEQGKKIVTIENTGDYDCYVRVKAFAGTDVQGSLTYSGSKWSLGDGGYYYYSEVLPAKGGKSTALTINVSQVLTKVDEEHDMNVIVIQECTPVQYDEDGNPYADWSVAFTTEDAS